MTTVELNDFWKVLARKLIFIALKYDKLDKKHVENEENAVEVYIPYGKGIS